MRVRECRQVHRGRAALPAGAWGGFQPVSKEGALRGPRFLHTSSIELAPARRGFVKRQQGKDRTVESGLAEMLKASLEEADAC